ncbi:MULTISPECIES: flavin reductase family protein [unclassified Curtobacterium]|uniref:flavin reductase family protein n=1 Tax=unclassified Curtobacterium TaxID=257496 RepID=UPI000DA76AB5|nr:MULTISPECIES: flavin reductase family protein [unclassified Curtobacterium]WIB69089.1 flavin reductase family protein [Curtobacterium sp. MCBD17_035]WIE54543.1 flavin reductase family protein [Curtobacterium sp. MCBD17_003]
MRPVVGPGVSPEAVRDAFAEHPSGVAAIGAVAGELPVVMVVSSFSVGVSYEPPMVSFAVQHTSTTWPDLLDAPVLGISVLGTGHVERTRQLASRDRSSRLRDLPFTITTTGALLLDGAPVWLECVVADVLRTGDHDLVVLRVLAVAADDEAEPLVWHRRTARVLAD